MHQAAFTITRATFGHLAEAALSKMAADVRRSVAASYGQVGLLAAHGLQVLGRLVPGIHFKNPLIQTWQQEHLI
jgi:hypothetical protein